MHSTFSANGLLFKWLVEMSSTEAIFSELLWKCFKQRAHWHAFCLESAFGELFIFPVYSLNTFEVK